MRPTPETDALDNLMFSNITLFAKCRDLERRLGECREALGELAKVSGCNHATRDNRICTIVDETLTATAPKP